ncbi:MAG: hypothetical protein V1859_04990 [archaeon]
MSIYVVSIAYDKPREELLSSFMANRVIDALIQNNDGISSIVTLHDMRARYDLFLKTLEDLADKMTASDILWLQYVGHGDKGNIINLPKNMTLAYYFSQFNKVPNAELLAMLDRIKGLKFCVFDCCSAEITLPLPPNTIYVGAAGETQTTEVGLLFQGAIYPTLMRNPLSYIINAGAYREWVGLSNSTKEGEIKTTGAWNISNDVFKPTTVQAATKETTLQDYYTKVTGDAGSFSISALPNVAQFLFERDSGIFPIG